MNTQLLDILNDAKHRHKFPPRQEILAIKSGLNARGWPHTSKTAGDITEACINSASLVLDEFAGTVLRNLSHLGLLSDSEVSDIFLEAFNSVSAKARRHSIQHTPGMQHWIVQICDDKLPPILDRLQRNIRLKNLNPGGPMSPIQITVGNIVMGSVSDSKLTATIAEIVNQGGNQKDMGVAIQNLLAVVGQMDMQHKAEQAELLDLIRALLYQVKLPKEERNATTIKLIWDRVVQVSQVSNAVVHVVQSMGAMLPGFLN